MSRAEETSNMAGSAQILPADKPPHLSVVPPEPVAPSPRETAAASPESANPATKGPSSSKSEAKPEAQPAAKPATKPAGGGGGAGSGEGARAGIDIEVFSRNLAQMVEEGGKAMAAYLGPR
ncbi:hypothetical protein ABLE93_23710, partial [Xanthobacter sp. KR7-65]